MTGQVIGNVLTVTAVEGRRVDWVKHNFRTRTTTGSVRSQSFARMLGVTDLLYQWMVQDAVVARSLGIE